MSKKSVVVLGAGFGGLRAAMDIAKDLRGLGLLDNYEVILIDRNNYHLYTPLLYKLAGSPEGRYQMTCTYDIGTLVKELPIRFVESEVTVLDVVHGDVHLKSGEEVRADYLVLALGSETNYFGIAGLKEHALQLKSLTAAMQVRTAIAKAFSKSGKVEIVIGGGGPNGIELAAEARAWADDAQQEDHQLKVSVMIVEAMPSILPGFEPRLVARAIARLKKIGVELTLNAKIVSVSAKDISIGGTTIPFDVFVWTGGIKTPDMLTALPVEKESRGKPMAQSDMACVPGTPDLKLAPMIYGLGDSVCFMDSKTNKPAPAVARVAILQGGIVAHNIIEEVKKAEREAYRPSLATYAPGNYPYVIPIGENWVVAKIGPIVFWGWLGAMFEKLIALHYLLSIMSFRDAFAAWKKM